MEIVNAPYWPNLIIQGCNTSKHLATYTHNFSGNRCIFFTDQILFRENHTQEVIANLHENGYNVAVYCEIEQNPTDTTVEKAVKFMRQTQPHFVIYYGGGSVIDLGKAANVLYTHGGKIHDYEDLNGGIDKITNTLLPSIAVATTAGSGSEVSSVSVITDTSRKLKMGILSPYLVPTISILDPVVTFSMPPNLTAYTGMDALAHAIEAYVSSINFEPGRGIAYKGIELINRSLRKAVYCGNDVNARMDMIVGSACGSMAFNNNFLGAVHGCAHQLSSIADLPHGLANAIMLPFVMEWNIPSNIAAYADIAKALGINVFKLSQREAAYEAVTAIKNLSSDIGIPRHLSDTGVTIDMLDDLIDRAFIDHNMLTNPRKSAECPDRISKEVIRALYMAAL